MSSNYAGLYKAKGLNAQEKRRKEILSNQQSKREDLLDAYRKIVNSYHGNVKNPKQTRRRHDELVGVLMLSEWLLQVPDDFSECWKFMICPEGRRCLVVAQNGITISVGKNGKEFGKRETPLPGGNSKQPAGTTILDCVYSFAKECYYVLDVLNWGHLPLVGTEMSCRQFWIQSRLKDELPELGDMRRPIVPLQVYPCTKDTFEDVLTQYPYFDNNIPKVDGVLFYHQDTLYTQGRTPLVGWLKVFMIREVLGVTVVPDYYDDRPKDYVNYLEFATEFDEQYSKKQRRRRTNGSDTSCSDDLIDVELNE